MTTEQYHAEVVKDVANLLGWHRNDATNLVGDVSEYISDGLTPREAAYDIVTEAAAEA